LNHQENLQLCWHRLEGHHIRDNHYREYKAVSSFSVRRTVQYRSTNLSASPSKATVGFPPGQGSAAGARRFKRRGEKNVAGFDENPTLPSRSGLSSGCKGQFLTSFPPAVNLVCRISDP
jgi:hypothetical protein